MKRRAFITLLGGTTLMPFAARAQQPMPVIDLLSSASPDDYAPMIAAFKKSLAEAGFVEERNVRIEYAWADEHYDHLPSLAADLVLRQVNVIVAANNSGRSCAQARHDHDTRRLCDRRRSRAHGACRESQPAWRQSDRCSSHQCRDRTEAARVMHELLPSQKVMGLLVNPANPLAASVSAEVTKAADILGIKLHVVHASDDQSIDRVFDDLVRLQASALVIGTDPLFTSRAKN